MSRGPKEGARPARVERLRIDLLGRFRLSVNGETSSAPISTRGHELLALLVLERGRVARARRVAFLA